ncbi:MAG: hypothetical protein WDM88_12410 [Galbitalea sp.]
MELIAKERDRLLQRTARFLGLAGTIIALIGLSFPGVVHPTNYFAAIPLLLLVGLSLIMVTRSHPDVWAIVGTAAGLATLVVVRIPYGSTPTPSLGSAIAPLGAAGIACFALVLVSSVPRLILLVVGAAGSTFLVQLATVQPGVLSADALSVILGWVLAGVLGYWLSASVPRAARRIYSIGKAHRAERQASETEAQRRQGARLLHDTVSRPSHCSRTRGSASHPRRCGSRPPRMPACCASCASAPPRPPSRRVPTTSRPSRRLRSARPSNPSNSASAGWGSRSAGTGRGRCCCRARSSTPSCSPSPSASRMSAGIPA